MGGWSCGTEDGSTPYLPWAGLLPRKAPEAPTWGAPVDPTLWPSPAGYLLQNPGHAVKQHLEEVPLKERPLGLMGVQGCESWGPAPGSNSGAAFLELDRREN